MKEIKIAHNQVLKNLNHFRTLLHKEQSASHKRKEQAYPIWIDCKTGDMELEEKRKEPITTKKQLQLIVKESEVGTTHFEIKGDLSELDQTVQKVASETIRILNLLTRENNVEDSIEMFPGWHGSCDRMRAEKLLQDMAVGSYLLRKPEELTEWMLKQCPMKARGYLLTVVEKEKKISDYLIVKTKLGWTLFQDDPDLVHYGYCLTLYELFEKIKKIAVSPCL